MPEIKKVAGWRTYPNPLRDEELVRFVTSSPDSNPLERNLALRLEKMLYQRDDEEIQSEMQQSGTGQMRLF